MFYRTIRAKQLINDNGKIMKLKSFKLSVHYRAKYLTSAGQLDIIIATDVDIHDRFI